MCGVRWFASRAQTAVRINGQVPIEAALSQKYWAHLCVVEPSSKLSYAGAACRSWPGTAATQDGMHLADHVAKEMTRQIEMSKYGLLSDAPCIHRSDLTWQSRLAEAASLSRRCFR